MSESYYAIGLDIGTNCGWALVKDCRIISSGIKKFPLEKDSGAIGEGQRFVNFYNWIRSFPNISDIYYEKNHMTQQSDAAYSVYYGMLAILKMAGATGRTRIVPIHTTTLKKEFTNNGRASKEEMAIKASEIGWHGAIWGPSGNILNHDEADAIAAAFVGMMRRDIYVTF